MTRTNRGLAVLVGLMLAFGLCAPAFAAARAQSSSSITLVAPDGWSMSSNGKVVAEHEADLKGAVPSGPRARILKAPHSKKTGVRPIVKLVRAAEKSDPVLVDGPTEVTFAGDLHGVVITFEETARRTSLVQRYVIVTPPGGKPTQIVLEAPEAQFAGAVDTLMTIVSG